MGVVQETVLLKQMQVLLITTFMISIVSVPFNVFFCRLDGKPDMINLMRLSTNKGVLKIMEQSAWKYRDIGTILLSDRSGARVRALREAALGDPVEAVYQIYSHWVREDVDYSWRKLAHCLRKCGLHVLASDIEKHFGLPAAQLSPEGMTVEYCTLASKIMFIAS